MVENTFIQTNLKKYLVGFFFKNHTKYHYIFFLDYESLNIHVLIKNTMRLISAAKNFKRNKSQTDR